MQSGLVDHPDEGQLATLMCVVDPVADDENVGYGETDEIRINCNFAATRVVDKRTGQDTRCFLLADQVARIQERAAVSTMSSTSSTARPERSSLISPIRRTLPELSFPWP